MLKELTISNFKSINEFSIELGRFNVFIGENGCGKSNILEALAFPTAAYNGTIENDFLALRGVRISDPRHYRTGFNEGSSNKPIKISIKDDQNNLLEWIFENDNLPFSKWRSSINLDDDQLIKEVTILSDRVKHLLYLEKLAGKNEFNEETPGFDIALKELLEQFSNDKSLSESIVEKRIATEVSKHTKIEDYLIYAPENFFLRNFKTEEIFSPPVGYRGEGLLSLIKIIKDNKQEQYKEIINNLVRCG